MKPIEERLRGLAAGEPLPPNTKEFATVQVPVGWLVEAIGVIEQYRRKVDGEERYMPSNLWY